MTELAVVRTFLDEVSAEIARARLEAYGIPALVRAPHAAGLLRNIVGVQVVVRRIDLDRARRVLDAPPGADVGEEGEGAEPHDESWAESRDEPWAGEDDGEDDWR